MVSIIGKAVIEPPLIVYFNLPLRSNNEECILKISAGKASRLGILARINDICRYDLEC